jgi:hypothetical protein
LGVILFVSGTMIKKEKNFNEILKIARYKEKDFHLNNFRETFKSTELDKYFLINDYIILIEKNETIIKKHNYKKSLGSEGMDNNKFIYFKNLYKKFKEKNLKFVIYSEYLKIIEDLKNYLNQKKEVVYIVTGDTKNKDKIINDFNETKGKFKIN